MQIQMAKIKNCLVLCF